MKCDNCHEEIMRSLGVRGYVHKHTLDAYCYTGDGATAMPETYNGYANEDSYNFDVIWANDQTLYNAIVAEGKRLLNWARMMDDTSLGRNILDALKATFNNGGWGYASAPEAFSSLPGPVLSNIASNVDLNNVNEAEFGANVREAVGNESEEG